MNTFKKTALTLFILLFSCAPTLNFLSFNIPVVHAAAGTTYYVDATNGLDSNNGTDPSTAWQTIAKVNAYTLSPGDSILFKRGETWRETLTPLSSGTSGNPITFGAYGSGDKPVISGADVVSGGWTQASGGGSSANVIYDNFDDSSVVFTTPVFGNPYDWGKTGTSTATNKRIEMTVQTGNTTPNILTDFNSNNEFWVSYDFTLASQSSSNGNSIQGGGLRDTISFSKDGYVGYSNVSGTPHFMITYSVNSSQVSTTTSTSITPGQKYRITIHWKKSSGSGANNGIIQVWADDSLVYEATNVNNDTLNNPSELFLGNNFRSGSSLTATLYFDNVKIGHMGSAPTAAASSNIWCSAFPGGAAEPLVTTFDGNYGYKQRSFYDLDSQYDWMWESGNLCVNAVSNPGSLYTIESASRNHTLDVQSKNYLNFDNINFTTGNQYTVFLEGNQSNNSFTSDEFQNGGLYNFVPNSNDTITDILLRGNVSSHAGGSGITFTNKQHWTVENNSSYRDGVLSSLYDYYTPDFPDFLPLTWSAGIQSYGTLNTDNLIEGNEVSYAGIRDDGYEPDTTNKGFGIWLDTVTTTAGNENIVRNNYVHDNAVSGLFSEKTKYSEWYGNVSANNGEYGLRVGTDENNKPVQNNVYYNNTLYGNATDLWVGGVTGSSGGAITNNTFKNNLAFGASTREFTAKIGGENDGTNGSGNVYDHNMFGPEANDFIEWGSGNFLDTYVALDSAYGSSTNSVAGDPLFTNAAGDDFTLSSASPAINAGLSLGSPYNLGLDPTSSWPDSVTTLDQSSNGSGYEIGAYVYPESAPSSGGGGTSHPPVSFGDMNVETGSTTASVSFSSSIPARLSFLLDDSSFSTSTIDFTTDHALSLSDLTPNTKYTYSIQLTGEFGQTGTFRGNFTTLAASATSSASTTTAPVLSLTASSSPSLLTRTLAWGSHDPEVLTLQHFLIPLYLSAGNDTGYFGPLTQAAVQKYQTTKGIVSSGTPLTTGFGQVGPLTRAMINAELSTTTATTTNETTIASIQEHILSLTTTLASLMSDLMSSHVEYTAEGLHQGE